MIKVFLKNVLTSWAHSVISNNQADGIYYHLDIISNQKGQLLFFYFIGLFYFTNEAIAITPITDFIKDTFSKMAIAFSKQTTDQIKWYLIYH